MSKLAGILAVSAFLFVQCQPPKVNIAPGFEEDIILVNIEEGDRAFIGKLIKTIDSCKPVVIAINVTFDKEKGHYEDSVLMDALRIARNDILTYSINPETGIIIGRSQPKFNALARVVCRTGYIRTEQGITDMIPIKTIKDDIHDLFPLKIVQLWKPDFRHNIKANEIVEINYTRTADQILKIDGSFLDHENFTDSLFKDKVVILGYLGPNIEDKHFTPLRLVDDHAPNEPDTYGSVILVNAIRTILERERKIK